MRSTGIVLPDIGAQPSWWLVLTGFMVGLGLLTLLLPVGWLIFVAVTTLSSILLLSDIKNAFYSLYYSMAFIGGYYFLKAVWAVWRLRHG